MKKEKKKAKAKSIDLHLHACLNVLSNNGPESELDVTSRSTFAYKIRVPLRFPILTSCLRLLNLHKNAICRKEPVC